MCAVNTYIRYVPEDQRDIYISEYISEVARECVTDDGRYDIPSETIAVVARKPFETSSNQLNNKQ